MINVFSGKVRKTGFFQKAGFPGGSERIFGIYYNCDWLVFRNDLTISYVMTSKFIEIAASGGDRPNPDPRPELRYLDFLEISPDISTESSGKRKSGQYRKIAQTSP
jgi:hypothetical protein